MIEMDKSNCYNPFDYIRSETDIIKLITNLIANTTPKNAQQNDPFWEKAETLYLQALFYYVWLECPEEIWQKETWNAADWTGKKFMEI